jgi:hypothetical protein
MDRSTNGGDWGWVAMVYIGRCGNKNRNDIKFLPFILYLLCNMIDET